MASPYLINDDTRGIDQTVLGYQTDYILLTHDV